MRHKTLLAGLAVLLGTASLPSEADACPSPTSHATCLNPSANYGERGYTVENRSVETSGPDCFELGVEDQTCLELGDERSSRSADLCTGGRIGDWCTIPQITATNSCDAPIRFDAPVFKWRTDRTLAAGESVELLSLADCALRDTHERYAPDTSNLDASDASSPPDTSLPDGGLDAGSTDEDDTSSFDAADGRTDASTDPLASVCGRLGAEDPDDIDAGEMRATFEYQYEGTAGELTVEYQLQSLNDYLSACDPSRQGQSDAATSSDAGAPQTDGTDRTGCHTAPGRPAVPVGWTALVAILLLARRRRRR